MTCDDPGSSLAGDLWCMSFPIYFSPHFLSALYSPISNDDRNGHKKQKKKPCCTGAVCLGKKDLFCVKAAVSQMQIETLLIWNNVIISAVCWYAAIPHSLLVRSCKLSLIALLCANKCLQSWWHLKLLLPNYLQIWQLSDSVAHNAACRPVKAVSGLRIITVNKRYQSLTSQN